MTIAKPLTGSDRHTQSCIPFHVICVSETGTFALALPPGTYELSSYGLEEHDLVTEISTHSISLPPDVQEVDVGTVELRLTNLGWLYGQPAPEWAITAAHGIRPDIRLADFRGKWVLLEFWTKSCGPCLVRGLPNLMAFYEHHLKQRDQFTILALHIDDGSVSDLAADLQQLSRKFWSGRSLPFPVLLVDEHTAREKYGIRSIPTLLFIDPDGNLVKGLSLDSFATLLNQ